MTPSRDPAPATALRVSAGLALTGLAGLVVITLASPGATRMHAWPWTLAYAVALLAPALALIVRAFDRHQPLILPATPWLRLALAATAVVLLAALASPYRGPSLLWSAPLLSAVAVFLLAVDWLQVDPWRTEKLAAPVGLFFAFVALVSIGLWASDLPGRSAADIAAARNPYPLGHSNYTAGLALLALPWFATLAWQAAGRARVAWCGALLLALALLFTSASRGGFLGLGALLAVTLLAKPIRRRRALVFSLAAAGLLLVIAHPRTRAMLAPADPAAAPNISNVQRRAMLAAARAMGHDRPLLGWGPGTTPLVYPRYRATLAGGTDTVLQLHSAPAQLWAELGAAGLLVALGAFTLAFRGANRHPTAAAALVGYGVFSLTDWQLDVPVFAFAVALCLALLAAPAMRPSGARFFTGGLALLALALIALLGRRDPTPELNLRALALARDPAQAQAAAALFRDSLARNPDQELAHFNLGWLLVVRDPAAAERHFRAAAQLVPDKGGVYFGLGLARLNQGHAAPAARAFALECLNDPAFLFSPWWREPALAAQRETVAAEFARLIALAAPQLPAGGYASVTLARVAALAPQLGRVPTGPERSYRRERTAYPVLARDLDLAPPVDLFDVRELATPAEPSLPPKGWLPTPLLLTLLESPLPAISSSPPRN